MIMDGDVHPIVVRVLYHFEKETACYQVSLTFRAYFQRIILPTEDGWGWENLEIVRAEQIPFGCALSGTFLSWRISTWNLLRWWKHCDHRPRGLKDPDWSALHIAQKGVSDWRLYGRYLENTITFMDFDCWKSIMEQGYRKLSAKSVVNMEQNDKNLVQWKIAIWVPKHVWKRLAHH